MKNIAENVQFLKEQKENKQISKEYLEFQKKLTTSERNTLNYIVKEYDIATLKKYEQENKTHYILFKKKLI